MAGQQFRLQPGVQQGTGLGGAAVSNHEDHRQVGYRRAGLGLRQACIGFLDHRVGFARAAPSVRTVPGALAALLEVVEQGGRAKSQSAHQAHEQIPARAPQMQQTTPEHTHQHKKEEGSGRGPIEFHNRRLAMASSEPAPPSSRK